MVIKYEAGESKKKQKLEVNEEMLKARLQDLSENCGL